MVAVQASTQKDFVEPLFTVNLSRVETLMANAHCKQDVCGVFAVIVNHLVVSVPSSA